MNDVRIRGYRHIDTSRPILDQLILPIIEQLQRQGASELQIREMAKTFHCGVHQTLLFLRDVVAPLPMAEGEAICEKTLAECERFVEGGWRSWKLPPEPPVGEDS